MANSTIENLSTLGLPDTGGLDVLAIVDDPAGSPVTKQITSRNLLKATITRDIYIPAKQFIPTTTNGAELTTVELATNDIMIDAAGFDTTTSEKIQFWHKFEENWNAGTVTFSLDWTNTAGIASETIDFDLAGHSYTDSDVLDAALGGTPANVTDTWTAQNDYQKTAFSGPVTLGGTVTDGNLNLFQLSRDVASDDLTGDAKIMGITIRYTVTDLASS
jgi:hypothetical protein